MESTNHKEVNITDTQPLKEVNSKEIKTEKKNVICQSDASKTLPNDPWQFVPHINLADRKVVVGSKTKPKAKTMNITSLKKFQKLPSDIVIPRTSLHRRKAVRIDSTTDTIPEILKNVLKDYNSISFLTQSH